MQREFWATCGCKFVLPIGHPATKENGCKCALHGQTSFWAETVAPQAKGQESGR